MPSPLNVERTIPGDYQLNALLHGHRFQRAWHHARLELVRHVLPPVDDMLMLDAAAGSGILTWRFPNRALVSSDMRVAACEMVRTHTQSARAVAGELQNLPFRNESFTRVYLLEAIEHLTEADGVRALEELRRVARRGAQCLLTTPNYHSHWPVIERALDALHLTPPMGGEQHVARYTRSTLADAVRAAGWRVRRVGSFNLLAPFAGILSPAAAAWLTGVEAARLGAGGALLFALCERHDG